MGVKCSQFGPDHIARFGALARLTDVTNSSLRKKPIASGRFGGAPW
jgi:hypothetical protein